MFRYIIVILALAVLLTHGIVHGTWTGRWADVKTPELWAEKMKDVPFSLSDWRGEELTIDPVQITKSQVTGYVGRIYTNRLSGEQVSVLIVCGPPGPVSVHSPDICYRGAGYAIGDIDREKIKLEKDSAAHEFFTSIFRKQSPEGVSRLQIYWAWNATGDWAAPSQPRMHFGIQPALYKLYVIRNVPAAEKSPTDSNPCKALMHDLLPQLEQTLFAS